MGITTMQERPFRDRSAFTRAVEISLGSLEAAYRSTSPEATKVYAQVADAAARLAQAAK